LDKSNHHTQAGICLEGPKCREKEKSPVSFYHVYEPGEIVIIELEPWEYVHASNVGIARFAANWGKKDALHYKKELMEDDRTATVAAAICELAVAKATNRFWSGHVWSKEDHRKYKDVPDVGRNIEVRRVRKGTTVALRRHQLGKGLILFAAQPVAPEFMTVDVWGWIDYDQAWELAEPSHYAPETTLLLDRIHLKTEW
jgi:hypothetical protein